MGNCGSFQISCDEVVNHPVSLTQSCKRPSSRETDVRKPPALAQDHNTREPERTKRFSKYKE
ncbi:unnamed protein product [Brassica oleracea var. botrytis]|uniref:Uncharacterized protein n=2 Tax=Brassica TaxID=3705 RepID=A0A3P6DSE8_BRAOL|nr:unnamed protein product [Brassica napus]CDY40963.1 BnaCnng10060D [Brassica napus]VDD29658.1 unnamed protein product [Brassica oleracea]